MTITRVERRRLSDSVVDQLMHLVSSGAFAVGERLPSERELARSLGVSRGLVRESFRILESLGVVEVKTGVGAIVAEHSPVTTPIAAYLRSHSADALDVLEVREGLAPLIGTLAANRMSEADLAEIERLHMLLVETLERGNYRELPALDDEFHQRIVSATGNQALVAIYEYTGDLLNNLNWNVVTLTTRAARSMAEHEAIVAALRDRNPQRAAAALRSHARRSNSIIRRLLSERLGEDPATDPRDASSRGAERVDRCPT